MPGVDGCNLRWWVAHTRPRCEKKLSRHCTQHALVHELVCYRSVKRYRGKTLTFHKPLFPGYLFVHATPAARRLLWESHCLVHLLEVDDEPLFLRQLAAIVAAMEMGYEIQLSPIISEGAMVRIKRGPLKGIEGWVETRQGPTTVLLRLDFISKAAAIKMDAADLILI